MSFQDHKLHGTACLAILLAWMSAVTGCEVTAGSPKRTGQGEADWPAYIYPDKPPLVDRASLSRLLTRLGSDRAILWVVSEIDDQSASTARSLAEQRDQISACHSRVMGLYAGPPSNWKPELLPMLRAAQTNFLFAVISPPSRASISTWLTGDPQQLDAGFYVADRTERIIARFGPGADQLAALLSGLAGERVTASGPARSSTGIIRARVRVIEPATGKVVARVAADAIDSKVLANDLAQQLAAAVKPSGTVAILPLRQTGRIHRVNTPLGDLLGDGLYRLGWSSVLKPASVTQSLANVGLTPTDVEFDPQRLAHRLGWKMLVVGSVQDLRCSTK